MIASNVAVQRQRLSFRWLLEYHCYSTYESRADSCQRYNMLDYVCKDRVNDYLRCEKICSSGRETWWRRVNPDTRAFA